MAAEDSPADGCGFWLGTAAVFTTLGAIGITIAVSEYHPPWPSAWFIAGSVVSALGCVTAIWALALHLAYKEAGRRWYPDLRYGPEAIQLGSATRLQGATTSTAKAILRTGDTVGPEELARWLRPVLREINGDLRQAAAGIEKARRDRSYSTVRHEFDLGQIWQDNRQRLAALEGRGNLYDTLRDAYAGIARMHRIVSRPGIGSIDPHELAGVLEAIRKAEGVVVKELAELG